jgi:hypothetical protein
MAMVCPQCSTTYEQRLQCPLCGTRLLFHDARRLNNRGFTIPLRWQQRPWGRLVIGLVLAQGLFYGLRHLLTAVLMATQGREAVTQVSTTASGILLLQGVQIACLLVGAVFAGAGQRQGLFLGGMVGAWNGVLSLIVLPGPSQALTTIAVLGQPFLQAVIGGAGGWIGSTFWKPLSTLTNETATPPRRGVVRRNMRLFAGRVAWFRVGAGVLLAVIGTLTATVFFEKILDLSHGALATTDEMQDRLITMEIKALSLLLGGALAGATTANGLKQGLCVGLGSAILLIGIEINYVEHWVQVGALTTVSAFCLGSVGGWFGSQLFPPVIKFRKQRGLGDASL